MHWLDVGTTAPLPGERRAKAPHPGPSIASAYLEPLGLDAVEFARLIGVAPERLAGMLAGTLAIDVDTAVRFGRSLGLPPERIMRAQLRHDFGVSRAGEDDMPLPPSDTLANRPFPANCLSGYLARVDGVDAAQNLYFVCGTEGAQSVPDLERVRRIVTGDRLRIYGEDGACLWAGPLLEMNGAPLFAFARRHQWQSWFARGLRADFFSGNAGAKARIPQACDADPL